MSYQPLNDSSRPSTSPLPKQEKKSWWSSLIDIILFNINAAMYSGWPGQFWIQPLWSPEEITSQEGKVVLITGANSGVGLVSAKELYQAGATVYMLCRTEKKAKEAIDWIKSAPSRQGQGKGEGKGKLEFISLDLTDLKSVKRAAEEFLRKETKLDILIANAGIMAVPEGQHTAQGYTLQFGSMVIGHQALISLLLPILLSTSRSSPEDPPRVISLSSAGHAMAPSRGVDYSSVIADEDVLKRIQSGEQDKDTVSRGKKEQSKWPEYGQSKWGNIALSKYLEAVYGPHRVDGLEGRKVGEGELINFSLHPGLIATNLANHLGPVEYIISKLPFIAALLAHTPDKGATNQLWAATMPVSKARELSGTYIVPFQRIGRARPDATVLANQVRLWDWCEGQVAKHI